jgi:hypothetical protein
MRTPSVEKKPGPIEMRSARGVSAHGLPGPGARERQRRGRGHGTHARHLPEPVGELSYRHSVRTFDRGGHQRPHVESGLG